MIMWSDQLDCTRPMGLSEDIIMHFWRIAWPGNGPSEGCSMKGQLAYGYKMINSFCEYVYFDVPRYMTTEKIGGWEYDKIIGEDEYSENIIGGIACGWEYGNPSYKTLYDRGLASAVYIMSDRLWNKKPIEIDSEYSKKLIDAILGAGTPDKLNLFDAIGDVIPNEVDLEKWIDNVKATDDELKTIIEMLGDEKCYKGSNFDRATAYKALIEAIIKEREKRG